jgi:hypothetical protein
MKKYLSITLLFVLCLFSIKGNATAACQTDDNTYGAVTLNVPNLPLSGTYNIWTRLQVPDSTHNQYRLEVNKDTCFEVGGSSISPGQWTWASFQNGDQNRKIAYDFTSTTGNSLKLIGTQNGVKIDRVLLVKNDCVPTGLGANCQSNSVATVVASGAIEIPPPSQGPVGGIVVPSVTILQNITALSSVVYYVDDRSVPASGFLLDTTLLTNGSHRVTMQITKIDGTVINEATTLEINNKQTAFSPLSRWARLNQRTAVTLSTVIGSGLLIVTAFLIIRSIRLRRRLLEFHGF